MAQGQRPVRVLQVVDGLNVYGAERVAFTLAKGVARAGLVSAVAPVRAPRDEHLGRWLKEDLAAANVACLDLATSGPPRSGRLAMSAWRLRGLLGGGAYDIVHVHTDIPEFVVALSGTGGAGGVRTLHNTVLWPGRPTLAALVERRLSHLVPVAISEGAAEAWLTLRNGGGRSSRKPPALIRNAAQIDLAELLPRAEARARLAIEAQSQVLAFVGRLAPQKGFDVLMAAVSHEAWPDRVQLHVFGDGPLRSMLDDARSGGAPVRGHGAVADVGRLYAAFDGLIAPSRFEGAVPLSVLDAMALRLPVAATACPGIAEDPTSDGLLRIEALTPEAICSAVQRLPGLSSSPASRDLSPQAMVDDYLALYRQQLRRGAARKS